MASALWPDYIPPEPNHTSQQTQSRSTIRSTAQKPIFTSSDARGGRVVVATTNRTSSYEAASKKPTTFSSDWHHHLPSDQLLLVGPDHHHLSSDPDSSGYLMDIPTPPSYAIPSDDDRDLQDYEGDADAASARSSDAGSRTASSRRSAASSSKPSGGSSGSAARSGNGDSSQTSAFALSNRRDQSETYIKLFVWHRVVQKPSAGAALAKAPLLRDVPNNMKRKLTGKRDSTSAPRFDATSPASSDRGIFKNAAPAWLRGEYFGRKAGLERTEVSYPLHLRAERPSKAKLTIPPVSTSGAWKRATAIFRENGVLSIYGDDRSLIVAIVTQHLPSSDVRIVDGSLFSRPFVLGIFSRPSPFGQQTSMPSPMMKSGPFASSSSKVSIDDRDEPIYLCFPTAGKLQRWRALLKMYAAPEVYGPPSTAERGGTYRTYRQIDMTVFEAKATLPLKRRQPTQDTRLAEGRLSPTAMVRSSSKGLDATAEAAEAQAQAQAQANVQISIDEALASINERDEMSSRGHDRPTLRQSLSVSNISSADADEMDSAGTSLHGDVAGQDPADVPLEDDDDDDAFYESGPISGGPVQAGDSEGDLTRSYGVANVGGRVVREEKEKDKHTAPAECYCLVSYGGIPAARTRVRQAPASAGGSIVWVEKFTFSDLPALNSMRVDVFQSNKTSSSSGTTSAIGLSETSLGADNSGAGAKFSLLGSVDLHMDTMRRGEDVEGWYPIWAPTGHVKEKDSIASGGKDSNAAHEEATRSHNCIVVGELKMTIRVREEAILPLRKYAAVEKVLNGPESTSLVRDLSRHLDEDTVLSHLVDVYVSGGTIVPRLEELASKETHLFGSAPGLQQESELLFRANTVLSRSLDKFQRLYCIDWLDSSIGQIVRRVCEERIWLDSDDGNVGAASPGGGAFEGKNATKKSDREVVESLRKLCDELWSCIYSSRHECPLDLSRILADLRSKVNTHFTQLQSPGPGIQGVGAFVFLRLICPAITTPHLYGLMAAPPDLRSSRTLMLLAKTFLALANKRSAFDKDKEPWLSQMNPFLRSHSLAYEDYITVVSTMPPAHAVPKQVPLGDEDDVPLQMAVQRRLNQLTPLHRESIPTATYMFDRPLAIASLVSYVVRASHLRGGALDDGSSIASGGPTSEGSADDKGASTKHSGPGPADDRITPFVELCCEIEEQTGYYIERAGFAARPLDVPPWPSPAAGAGNNLVVSAGRTTRVSVGDKNATTTGTAAANANANARTRRATVSNASSIASVSASAGFGVVGGAKALGVGSGGGLGHGQVVHERGIGVPTTSFVDEDSFLRTRHRLPLHYGPSSASSSARSSVPGSGTNTSTGPQEQQDDSEDELRMAYATFNAEERSGIPRTGGVLDGLGSGGSGGGAGVGVGGGSSRPRESSRRHSSDLARVTFGVDRYGVSSGGSSASTQQQQQQQAIYSADEDDLPHISNSSGLGPGPLFMGAVPQRTEKGKKKKWWKG